jgi:hypothetical protein
MNNDKKYYVFNPASAQYWNDAGGKWGESTEATAFQIGKGDLPALAPSWLLQDVETCVNYKLTDLIPAEEIVVIKPMHDRMDQLFEKSEQTVEPYEQPESVKKKIAHEQERSFMEGIVGLAVETFQTRDTSPPIVDADKAESRRPRNRFVNQFLSALAQVDLQQLRLGTLTTENKEKVNRWSHVMVDVSRALYESAKKHGLPTDHLPPPARAQQQVTDETESVLAELMVEFKRLHDQEAAEGNKFEAACFSKAHAKVHERFRRSQEGKAPLYTPVQVAAAKENILGALPHMLLASHMAGEAAHAKRPHEEVRLCFAMVAAYADGSAHSSAMFECTEFLADLSVVLGFDIAAELAAIKQGERKPPKSPIEQLMADLTGLLAEEPEELEAAMELAKDLEKVPTLGEPDALFYVVDKDGRYMHEEGEERTWETDKALATVYTQQHLSVRKMPVNFSHVEPAAPTQLTHEQVKQRAGDAFGAQLYGKPAKKTWLVDVHGKSAPVEVEAENAFDAREEARKLLKYGSISRIGGAKMKSPPQEYAVTVKQEYAEADGDYHSVCYALASSPEEACKIVAERIHTRGHMVIDRSRPFAATSAVLAEKPDTY